ncbi:MAG: Rubredoxin [Euryarchaeota archaeon ADurb.BinA087]|nr:MAG: Rubredoxin [Euryarchaeota archaeon ADurb.BinA087]
MARWKCTVCGYVYDEAKGEPATDTPPHTPFTSLPEDWHCPVCGAPRDSFVQESGEDVHASATTTVSDIIVDEMERWGVDLVFGLPGTSALGIFDAIRKNKSIRLIVVRHEANAAFAAAAYNKLTGRIAACLTIAGPGATNLATGLYDAKEDRASVFSLNGQVEMQYTGPGGLQEIDQDAFFRPVTVFNNTIYDKSMTARLVTMALKHAILDHGVAQLSVPNNIQKEPLDARYCSRETCIPRLTIQSDEPTLRAAARAIDNATRPVILAGWGVHDLPDLVVALAEKIKAPVLTTFRAKGILPDDHPWLVGMLGTSGSPQARKTIDESDLIIALGVGFSRMTGVPRHKPIVQLESDPRTIGKIPYTAALWGNARLEMPRLVQEVQGRDDPSVLPRIASLRKTWNDLRDKEADAAATPIRPPYIMKVLSETVPDDAVISLDTGDNMWWFGRNFRMKHQQLVFSGYLGSMGTGLPGAIAAKIAYPEKSVICITGDGGFSQAMPDLVTTVKYHLPMVIVVLNNRELAMIQVEQRTEGYPNYATDLLNPDFARFAEACGCQGISVKNPGELRAAIEKALALNQPVVVDIDTDPRRF